MNLESKLNTKMQFKKQYTFETWNGWNDTICHSSQDFFNVFGFYPNILEANRHTFSQIDFICNINKQHTEKIYKADEITGEKDYSLRKGEEVSIAAFYTDKYQIEFAWDDDLKDKEFVLFYEDESDDDDEDTPVETTPSELTFA